MLSGAVSGIIAGIVCQIIFYLVAAARREADIKDREILEAAASAAFLGLRGVCGLIISFIFSLYYSVYIFMYVGIVLQWTGLDPAFSENIGAEILFISIVIVNLIYINYRILIDTKYIGLRDLSLNYLKGSATMLMYSVFLGVYLLYNNVSFVLLPDHYIVCGAWMLMTGVVYATVVFSEEDL